MEQILSKPHLTDNRNTAIRLIMVLKRIEKNNYYFIPTENRAVFEVCLEKYRNQLPDEYKYIIKQFELNTERWNSNPKKKLNLSQYVLDWLENNTCKSREIRRNGKPFIEDANAKPLKWLQNKQLLYELLIHPKIKGNLTNKEIEDQTPILFINIDNEQLKLAKNKPTMNSNSDKLATFLNSL